MVATLVQCAKLCDWKLIPYLERKKEKLDPIEELALERAFNVQTSTMPRKHELLAVHNYQQSSEYNKYLCYVAVTWKKFLP